jgi:hypothetical protein
LGNPQQGEFIVALRIPSGDRDRKDAACVKIFGAVREGAARKHAFGFISDVEVHELRIHGDDGALQLLPIPFAPMRVGLFELGELLGEGDGGWGRGLGSLRRRVNGRGGSREGLVRHLHLHSILSRTIST